MQDPIFDEYGIDGKAFWAENNQRQVDLRKIYSNIRINADTYYLNLFLQYIREEKFKDLDNKKLRKFGKNKIFIRMCQDFYLF